MNFIEFPVIPDPPKTRKVLLQRVPGLYGNEYPILPECKRGTGAPGTMTELLLGSEGSNKSFGDTVGTELKWKSRSPTPLTMFHLECDPNGTDSANTAMIPILKECGYPGKHREVRFCHTVSSRSKLFHSEIVKVNGERRIVLRTASGYEVFWKEDDVLNAASKLKHLVLVDGSVNKESWRVSIYAAQYLTGFRGTKFLDLIENRTIMVDFDFHGSEPGKIHIARNHGTKFRIKMKNLQLLWDSITPIV